MKTSLAQANTLADAQRVLNRFLPRYNARFARSPSHPVPAWRPAPADLERICCFKYQRTVHHDNTVQLDGRYLQLQPGPARRSYTGLRVDVHAHLDGRLTVSYRGLRIAAQRLPVGYQPRSSRFQDPSLEGELGPDTSRPTPEPPSQEAQAPPSNSPWRRMIHDDIWRHRAEVTFSQIR